MTYSCLSPENPKEGPGEIQRVEVGGLQIGVFQLHFYTADA